MRIKMKLKKEILGHGDVNQNDPKYIKWRSDTIHRGSFLDVIHVLDCMVTRGIAINAKEGDCWKLQLE